MSWAEIKRAINSSLGTSSFKPLNEYIKDVLTNENFGEATIITESQVWTANKSGVYKVICVGEGGTATDTSSGGSGGVVVEKVLANEGDSYNIVIDGDARFGSLCTATRAQGAIGGGGNTNGTGVVYSGINGKTTSLTNPAASGADVRFFDPKYMSLPIVSIMSDSNVYMATGGQGLFGGRQSLAGKSSTSLAQYIASGGGGYGAGGGRAGSSNSTGVKGTGGRACVYIELIYEE